MIEAKVVNYPGSTPKRAENQLQFEEKQVLKHLRKLNEIRAYKILAVEGKKITIPLPPIFEGRTATFKLNMKFNAEYHVPGNYVDVIVDYQIYHGEAPCSYRLTYVGITPQDFIPTSGEEIA